MIKHSNCGLPIMTEQQLSPGAQAALDAGMEYSGPAFEPLVRRMVAASLRAATDQVAPAVQGDVYDCCLTVMEDIRADLLAIADELEETLP